MYDDLSAAPHCAGDGVAPRAESSPAPVVRQEPRRRLYLPVPAKFALVLLCSLAWAAMSVYLSLPWLDGLSAVIGFWMALFVIAFIAYVPGFMNAFMVGSILSRPAAVAARGPRLPRRVRAGRQLQRARQHRRHAAEPGPAGLCRAGAGAGDRRRFDRWQPAAGARRGSEPFTAGHAHGGDADGAQRRQVPRAQRGPRGHARAAGGDGRRRLLPAHRRTATAGRALPVRPAGHDRGGRLRAGAQFAAEPADPRPGVGLFPRDRRGQAHAEHVSRHAGRAGCVLAVHPRFVEAGRRLAGMRGRGHRPVPGAAQDRCAHRLLRGGLPVHQCADHRPPVLAPAPALVARLDGGVRAALEPAVQAAHVDAVHLVEPAVPAAGPYSIPWRSCRALCWPCSATTGSPA